MRTDFSQPIVLGIRAQILRKYSINNIPRPAYMNEHSLVVILGRNVYYAGPVLVTDPVGGCQSGILNTALSSRAVNLDIDAHPSLSFARARGRIVVTLARKCFTAD